MGAKANGQWDPKLLAPATDLHAHLPHSLKTKKLPPARRFEIFKIFQTRGKAGIGSPMNTGTRSYFFLAVDSPCNLRPSPETKKPQPPTDFEIFQNPGKWAAVEPVDAGIRSPLPLRALPGWRLDPRAHSLPLVSPHCDKNSSPNVVLQKNKRFEKNPGGQKGTNPLKSRYAGMQE